MDPLRLLFVEDVQDDAELAELELGKEGVKLTSARVYTEEQLKKALPEFRPDLVLCDYSMPRFSGMEALEIIQKFDPILPVIMFTGSINEEVAVECMKRGAADYILKDHITRLPFAVKEALVRKRLLEEREKANEEEKRKTAELERLNAELRAARKASLNIMEDLSEEIRQRELAKMDLEESEASFRSIFEKSAAGYTLTSPEGKLLRVNTAFSKMLGYTLDEMQQLNFQTVTHPDDLSVSEEAIQRLIKGKRDVSRFEKRYFHKEGFTVWTHIVTTLFCDKANIPLYFITCIIDITARKLAEDELRNKIYELERFNDLTVDRELKMIEMKKEINALLHKLGEKEKYRIVE